MLLTMRLHESAASPFAPRRDPRRRPASSPDLRWLQTTFGMVSNDVTRERVCARSRVTGYKLLINVISKKPREPLRSSFACRYLSPD